jgi:preprotein translocase subunit SecB
MGDQDSPNQNNGSGEDQTEPQIATLAQYIKDLSVENPSSPQVFQWQTQPTPEVQIGLNSAKVADDVHEVSIKFELTARSENGVHFVVDLTYAGLFGLRNIPDEALGPILLVELPRMLFPFARQIIADAVGNTGFPPLLLDPIDFGAAYMAQLEAAQQEDGAGGTAPAETPSEEPTES